MQRPRLLAVLALIAATFMALTGCGSSTTTAAGSGTPTPSAAVDSFPISINHVYGTTTITAKPTRIATVAWSNHEVPLALGVIPVGMSKATWGDDDNDGVLPWVEKKLADLGAATAGNGLLVKTTGDNPNSTVLDVSTGASQTATIVANGRQVTSSRRTADSGGRRNTGLDDVL